MKFCVPVEVARDDNGNVQWKCLVCGELSNGFDLAAHFPNKIYRPCGKQIGPSSVKRLLNFSIATITHVYNRLPTCTQSQIDERAAICKACEFFRPNSIVRNVGVCTHPDCGCCVDSQKWFISKLAWADQECPIKKWRAVGR
jgi:hypothetical protein